MINIRNSNLYRERMSESELCYDFPGDELFINGLHAMQMHFLTNNIHLTIPVVRVMNSAHFLAAYMFSTTCSGDQMEYDLIASDYLGRDRQMSRVTIIVLAAMLKRTKGMRAANCRQMILADRDDDFNEGVLLYNRFLLSAEQRFEEESFLIDTHSRISHLIDQNQRLSEKYYQLQVKYSLMQNQQNNQYNNCVIYNAPVYNTTNNTNNTTNHYYNQQAEVGTPSNNQSPTTNTSNDAPFAKFIPRKNNYNEVRIYIEERKRHDVDFRDYCQLHTLRDLCGLLSREFGWFVDDNHLGRNLSRNR